MIQKWEKAAIRKTPEGKMKAHMSPTDRVMENLNPVKIENLGMENIMLISVRKFQAGLHLQNVQWRCRPEN